MAHVMNSEISRPFNNNLYTEYGGAFSVLFRLSTLKLFMFRIFGNG